MSLLVEGAGGWEGRVDKVSLLKFMEDVRQPDLATDLVNLMEGCSLLHSIVSTTALVPPLLPYASAADGVKRLHKEFGLAGLDGAGWCWWHACAPAAEDDASKDDKSLVALLALMGSRAAQERVEQLGPSLPVPGNEVARLVSQLLAVVDAALINSGNLKRLQKRVLAFMDILVTQHQGLVDLRRYQQAVATFTELLKEMIAWAQMFVKRNGALRLLTAGSSDKEQFEEFMLAVSELHDMVIMPTTLYRCKLMLVGPGGAGKTTLVSRLMKDEFRLDPGATDGLGVHEWSLPLPQQGLPDVEKGLATALNEDKNGNISFSLWDFGGQEVYETTNAFFMTRNAVYLVLYRSRDDHELSRLREYLDKIQALARGAPMVLVGTHAGESTEGRKGVYSPVQPPTALFEAFSEQLHPKAIFVSSKTGYGMNELKEVLLKEALKLPLTCRELPEFILKLREEVQRARAALPSATEPLLTYGDYRALATAAGIAEDLQLRLATLQLTDLGDLLYFGSVPGLEDVVVLRPQWVGEVMAQVVTMDGYKKSLLLVKGEGGFEGCVSKDSLLKLMEDVSPDLATGLVNLMERLSLLYSIDSTTALVPSLLPYASAADGVKRLHKEFGLAGLDGAGWCWWHAQYTYSYLPDALLCRMLCRLFAENNVEVLEAWRFGAVLRRNGHLVCIMQGGTSSLDTFGRSTLAVTVCGMKPHALGTLVSSKLLELREEAFTGVKLEKICYGCSSCFQLKAKEPGLVDALKCKKAVMACCRECYGDVDVQAMVKYDDQAQQLLAGKQDAKEALILSSIERLSVQLGNVEGAIVSKLDGMQATLAEGQADVTRHVLALHKGVAQLDAQVMPTLHVILPMPSEERAWYDVKGLVKARFRLHLLCEHPGGPHVTLHGGYEIERPREFLRKNARGLRVLSHATGLLLGAGVHALTGGTSDGGLGRLGQLVDQHVLDEPLKAFERMNELLDTLQKEKDNEEGGKQPPPPPPAGSSPADWQARHRVEFEGCQQARREIQLLIERLDKMRAYGNLQKVVALSGDVLWLCTEHAACHPAAFKLR